jgi:hypothetical protein
MERVIDLSAWRRDRHGAGLEEERLERAVERLDRVLAERGEAPSPPWLVTELLAVQGCLSMGLTEDAAWRIERLLQRAERSSPRSDRAR